MICSSVNLDRFIIRLLHKTDSTQIWRSFWGSGHLVNKKHWLGAAERIVYEALCTCAPYVSPFSINNPEGWRYWLVHFANFYRAREVYNDTLHENSSSQAHFGRSGLRMLHYDPAQENENSLYLFNQDGRTVAQEQLFDDIPRLVSNIENSLFVEDFYSLIYNATPAHSDDIRSTLIKNPDLEIKTSLGGERRTPHTIELKDVIRLKPQKSFSYRFKKDAD